MKKFDKKQIIQNLGIKYSSQEKSKFDDWLRNLPKGIIAISNVLAILDFLPPTANYASKELVLFFEKKTGVSFDWKELHLLLKQFSSKNPEYEIAVSNVGWTLLIGIGDKMRNGNVVPMGHYFAHYHPTQSLSMIPNKNSLPEVFLYGLMPSYGDVKGFSGPQLNYIQDGTRIYSSYGYTKIIPMWGLRDVSKNSENLSLLNDWYFGLFAGMNTLNIASQAEIKKLFRQKFLLDIQFHILKSQSH